MTATKHITLWCDGTPRGQPCTEWADFGLPSVSATRTRARAIGWIARGKLDYRAACAPLQQKPTLKMLR